VRRSRALLRLRTTVCFASTLSGPEAKLLVQLDSVEGEGQHIGVPVLVDKILREILVKLIELVLEAVNATQNGEFRLWLTLLETSFKLSEAKRPKTTVVRRICKQQVRVKGYALFEALHVLVLVHEAVAEILNEVGSLNLELSAVEFDILLNRCLRQVLKLFAQHLLYPGLLHDFCGALR